MIGRSQRECNTVYDTVTAVVLVVLLLPDTVLLLLRNTVPRTASRDLARSCTRASANNTQKTQVGF